MAEQLYASSAFKMEFSELKKDLSCNRNQTSSTILKKLFYALIYHGSAFDADVSTGLIRHVFPSSTPKQ